MKANEKKKKSRKEVKNGVGVKQWIHPVKQI